MNMCVLMCAEKKNSYERKEIRIACSVMGVLSERKKGKKLNE